MKFFLTTTGTRGDVQPLVALGLKLKELGHEAKFCVPPNFQGWIEQYGFECLPIGFDVERSIRKTHLEKPASPSADQAKFGAGRLVRYQLAVLLEAARGCDLIVGGGITQIPTRTVAEILQIPCILAAYCPVVYPSLQHPPPPMFVERLPELMEGDNASLWIKEEQYWNDMYREVLNEERAKFLFAPVENVLCHVLEGQSMLAADATVTPLAAGIMYNMQVVQTGAWMLPGLNKLPDHVEQFLTDGEAPIYFGCGSMVVKENGARIFVETARALGRRAIIYKGWSGIQPVDDGNDCLFVDAIAHDQLFPHMAAIVHHGGAGTTIAAARSGVAQIILPHAYDQFYLAQRIQQMGIGVAGPDYRSLNAEALTACVRECLRPEIGNRAKNVANKIELNGAGIAAEWLINQYL